MANFILGIKLFSKSWYSIFLLAIGCLLLLYSVYNEYKRLKSLIRASLLTVVILIITIIVSGCGPIVEFMFDSIYQNGFSAFFIYFNIIFQSHFSDIIRYLLFFGIVTGIYITAITSYGKSLKQYRYYSISSAILIFSLIDFYICFISKVAQNAITNYLVNVFCNTVGGIIIGYFIVGYLYNYFNNILDKESDRDNIAETIKLLKYCGIIIFCFLLSFIIFILPLGLKIHISLTDWEKISFFYKTYQNRERTVIVKEPALVTLGKPLNNCDIKFASFYITQTNVSKINNDNLIIPISISIKNGNKTHQIYRGKISGGNLNISGKGMNISIQKGGLKILHFSPNKRVSIRNISSPLFILREPSLKATNSIQIRYGNIALSASPNIKIPLQLVISSYFGGMLRNCKIILPNGKKYNILNAANAIITLYYDKGLNNYYQAIFSNITDTIKIVTELKDKLWWISNYGELVNKLSIANPKGIIYYNNKQMQLNPTIDSLYIGSDGLQLNNNSGKLSVDGSSNEILLGGMPLTISLWQQMGVQLQSAILGALIGLWGGYLIGLLSRRQNKPN